MTDRLLQLANSPWTAPLVRALGLPQPKPLRRRADAYADAEFAGRAALVLGSGFAADGCRRMLAEHGADLAPAGALHAIVFDATNCASAASLDALHDLLRSAVGRLRPCGRVVLLVDAAPASPEAAAAARGAVGFTRALAKELGRRGGTVSALALTPAALPALDAALAFFATDRSAYVSGQVLRLRDGIAAATSGASRTAVVTGAAGGIGAATAHRLAADGTHVVCVDVPQASAALGGVAAAIGGTAVPLDITATDAGAQLVEALAARGGVDIVVHNAGITRDRTFLRMSGEEWGRVMSVNLRAVLELDGALDAAGLMRDGAREICLSSISGIAGNAGQTNYSASKAALIGYVEARAEQLRARGITVNAIAPGFIETRMTDRIPFMVREAGRRMNALAQGGRPEDVAEAIAFLARPQSHGVTGQTLRVCGQSLLGA